MEKSLILIYNIFTIIIVEVGAANGKVYTDGKCYKDI